MALALVGFVVLWDRKFLITLLSLMDAGSASNTITKHMSDHVRFEVMTNTGRARPGESTRPTTEWSGLH